MYHWINFTEPMNTIVIGVAVIGVFFDGVFESYAKIGRSIVIVCRGWFAAGGVHGRSHWYLIWMSIDRQIARWWVWCGSLIPPDVLLFLLFWVQAVWWFLMFVLLSMWLQISIHVFKSQMTFTPWTLPIRWYGNKAGLSWEHNRPLEDIPTSPSCDHHSVVVGEEIVRGRVGVEPRLEQMEHCGTDWNRLPEARPESWT